MAEINVRWYAARMNALRKTTKSLNCYSIPPKMAVQVLESVASELRRLADTIEHEAREFRLDLIAREAEKEGGD